MKPTLGKIRPAADLHVHGLVAESADGLPAKYEFEPGRVMALARRLADQYREGRAKKRK